MRIAILGWGSLVWDRRNLAIAGELRPVGPIMPLQFSRISRGGRVTLVIDEVLGVPCVTYAAASPQLDLDWAIRNLQMRENMPRADDIGFVDLGQRSRSPVAMERHPRTVMAIQDWAMRNGFRAVIWTALAGNFHEPYLAGVPFSVDAALDHLAGLPAADLGEALRYIRNAPPEIRCDLRAAVDQRWPKD